MEQSLKQKAMASLNRLCKWRSVFTGWQLGTRPLGDPESDALRDHREQTIILRAEASTLLAVLVKKGICTAEEFTQMLGEEAERLSADYSKRFPGFKAADHGMEINVEIARDTMQGWKK